MVAVVVACCRGFVAYAVGLFLGTLLLHQEKLTMFVTSTPRKIDSCPAAVVEAPPLSFPAFKVSWFTAAVWHLDFRRQRRLLSLVCLQRVVVGVVVGGGGGDGVVVGVVVVVGGGGGGLRFWCCCVVGVRLINSAKGCKP